MNSTLLKCLRPGLSGLLILMSSTVARADEIPTTLQLPGLVSAPELVPPITALPPLSAEADNSDVIQARHPNGKIRLERQVTQDANDNFVNHGSWVMFNDRDQETARGEYRLGKRHGNWVRTHVTLRELDLTLPPNAAQFTPPFLSVAQFVEGELHGPWTVIDANDRKVMSLNYAVGKREGRNEWFYPNGSPWREIEYKQGVRAGQLTEWSPDRSVAKQYRYLAGQRIVQQTEWHAKGVKKLAASYLQTPEYAGTVDDWWAGSSRELPIEQRRQGSGPAISLQAVVGMRHGGFQGWHANGQPAITGQFEQDQPVGQFKWWYANGQQACVGQYERSQPCGHWVWWHANGQKESQGSFIVGGQQGKWLWWDSEGRVAKSALFDDASSGLQLALRPEGLRAPQIDIDPASTSRRKNTAQTTRQPSGRTRVVR